jgi:hypothetical protein
MDTEASCYLLKHDDGTLFGPMPFDQLRSWADKALVSPLDKVSNDQTTWLKAPMATPLGMDWLIQLGVDELYGPTTLGAVNEFFENGEISEDTLVINCCDGKQLTVRDLEGLAITKETSAIRDTAQQPKLPTIRVSLQQRVRDLEAALLEERRYVARLEIDYQKLQAKYNELNQVRK